MLKRKPNMLAARHPNLNVPRFFVSLNTTCFYAWCTMGVVLIWQLARPPYIIHNLKKFGFIHVTSLVNLIIKVISLNNIDRCYKHVL
ncbi:hypothetical protein Hanom_Chr09g00871191 [Helianthus anomalus]